MQIIDNKEEYLCEIFWDSEKEYILIEYKEKYYKTSNKTIRELVILLGLGEIYIMVLGEENLTLYSISDKKVGEDEVYQLKVYIPLEEEEYVIGEGYSMYENELLCG